VCDLMRLSGRRDVCLNSCVIKVDTSCMTGIDLNFDLLAPDCIAVLNCYALRDLTSKSENPEYSGWLNRVDDVAGVDPTSLTRIHGMLIAQGMLKFEITGRSVGLQYQISSSGREAIARQQTMVSDSDSELMTESMQSSDEAQEDASDNESTSSYCQAA
jgi:hypothetical protein